MTLSHKKVFKFYILTNSLWRKSANEHYENNLVENAKAGIDEGWVCFEWTACVHTWHGPQMEFRVPSLIDSF